MKKFKKSAFCALLLVLLLVPIIALAAEKGYVSTIKISANSTLSGKARNYSHKNHRIKISTPKINYGYEESDLVIALYSHGLFSANQVSRKIGNFKHKKTNTVTMGNHGSGKRSYSFGTYQNALKDGNSGHGIHYPGLSSDNVYLESY